MPKQFKYNQARFAILDHIARNGLKAGDKLPPERELLSVSNSSIVTVRSALRDLAEQGIIEKCQGVGSFLRQEIACSAMTGSVLLMNARNHIPTEGLSVMQNFLRQRGLELIYMETERVTDEVIRAASTCQGIILYNWASPDQCEVLRALRLPMLLLGNVPPAPGIPQVELDPEGATRELTRSLPARGFRRIGLVNGENHCHMAEAIKTGFLAAMGEAGIAVGAEDMLERGSADFSEALGRMLRRDYDALVVEYGNYPILLAENWFDGRRGQPHLGIASLMAEIREQNAELYRVRPGMTLSVFPESIFLVGARLFVDRLLAGKALASPVKLSAVLETQ